MSKGTGYLMRTFDSFNVIRYQVVARRLILLLPLLPLGYALRECPTIEFVHDHEVSIVSSVSKT